MSAILMAAFIQLASALGIDEAEANARRDEASLSEEFQGAFAANQRNAIGRSLVTCGVEEAREVAGVMVVLKLDADGRVVESWLNEQTEIGTCFEREISKFVFPADGRPEFYTFINFDF
jgi:hypothetical protein